MLLVITKGRTPGYITTGYELYSIGRNMLQSLEVHTKRRLCKVFSPVLGMQGSHKFVDKLIVPSDGA